MSEKTDGPPRSKPPDGNVKPHGRSYAHAARGRGKIQMTQILNEYMKIKQHANDHQRNLIEISFSKIDHHDTEVPDFPSLETECSYILDVLKINPADGQEIDHFSHREKKQILLRDGLDIDKFRINLPDTFKGYIVKIEKLTQTKTRILFKNVPIDCPNVELENLCNAYGIRDGNIYKQYLNVPTANNGEVRLPTTIRYAMVKLHPDKALKNFYWSL